MELSLWSIRDRVVVRSLVVVEETCMILIFEFSSLQSHNFWNTIRWKCSLKDDCIRSSLIECQSFSNRKININPKYRALMFLPSTEKCLHCAPSIAHVFVVLPSWKNVIDRRTMTVRQRQTPVKKNKNKKIVRVTTHNEAIQHIEDTLSHCRRLKNTTPINTTRHKKVSMTQVQDKTGTSEDTRARGQSQPTRTHDAACLRQEPRRHQSTQKNSKQLTSDGSAQR